jgi:hypothetical protein
MSAGRQVLSGPHAISITAVVAWTTPMVIE